MRMRLAAWILDSDWLPTHALCWLLLLLHSHVTRVLGNAVPRGRCCEACVHFAVHRCNQHLADIGSMILRQAGDNYTDVCRCFTGYVECIEPNVRGCQSVILQSYHFNCDLYSRQPYWCAVPDTSHLPPTALDIPHYSSPSAVFDGSQFSNIEWTDDTVHIHSTGPQNGGSNTPIWPSGNTTLVFSVIVSMAMQVLLSGMREWT